MIRILFFMACVLSAFTSAAQQSPEWITDVKGNCNLWAPGHTPQDSVSWTGGCKAGLAYGNGIMVYYSGGQQTMYYNGEMEEGRMSGQGQLRLIGGIQKEGMFRAGDLNGKGSMTYDEGRKKLSGNFENGLLTLDDAYTKRLYRNVIADTDTANMYVGDGDAQQLFYTALIPQQKLKGVLMLMTGTWETVAHALGSNRDLCQQAYDQGIAVIIPSLNQRLVMNDQVLAIINEVLEQAIKKYNLPKDHFIIGGWSMGGLFSLRYAELAVADPSKTVIVPKAVISVDGPADLETLYHNSERSLKKNPQASEPRYIVEEFKKYIGGTPETAKQKYIDCSTFSKSEEDGGNARYLLHMPLRIYNDVDVNWWMDNRGRDLYDMNALDQSAMINLLRQKGNVDAEFINAYGKGFRLEGNRHPHSWSIVDAADCMAWILKWIQ